MMNDVTHDKFDVNILTNYISEHNVPAKNLKLKVGYLPTGFQREFVDKYNLEEISPTGIKINKNNYPSDIGQLLKFEEITSLAVIEGTEEVPLYPS